MQKFKFAGSGAGIPGLPHEISRDEIDLFNVEQAAAWQEALAARLYVEVAEPKPVRMKSKKPDESGGGEQS